MTSHENLLMNLLKAMQLFVRTVREGSLTGAAAEHDLSPTMVGNHLRSLEAHLGMKLLSRTTRTQQLTEFGQIFFDRCVEILDLVEDAEASAQDAQQEPRGRLRVTAPHAFGIDQLMPALADYRQRHPGVEPDVAVTDQRVNLLEGRFEAAIRIGNLADAGTLDTDVDLIARPLASLQLVICAAPMYLTECDRPEHPDDLTDHRCLVHADALTLDWRTRTTVWRLQGPDGEIELALQGTLRADSAQALRQAALAGMGITLLPLGVVQADLDTGRLLPLLASFPPSARPMHLLYRRDRLLSPKLRSFIDFMLERFGPSPSPSPSPAAR